MSKHLASNTLGRNRHRLKLVLVYLFVLAPWIGFGALQALRPAANSPLDWVDNNFAPRAQYDKFTEQFGTGDVVVISWPECKLGNAKVDRFVRCLRKSPAFIIGRFLQKFPSRRTEILDERILDPLNPVRLCRGIRTS